MAELRILVITSDQKQPGFNHERMLALCPKFREYKFQYTNLLFYSSRFYYYNEGGFQEILNEIVNTFNPNYILVHTGSSFTGSPAPVIKALVDLEKKHPSLRIGFQDGKEFTVKMLLKKRSWLSTRLNDPSSKEIEMLDDDLISLIENAPIFTETDELKELVEQVFMDRT